MGPQKHVTLKRTKLLKQPNKRRLFRKMKLRLTGKSFLLEDFRPILVSRSSNLGNISQHWSPIICRPNRWRKPEWNRLVVKPKRLVLRSLSRGWNFFHLVDQLESYSWVILRFWYHRVRCCGITIISALRRTRYCYKLYTKRNIERSL